MPKEPHKYQGLEERMSDHKNADEKGPTHDLRGDTEKHPDRRDTQGGTLDELPGDRSGEQVKEHRTPHEDAQWGADVRAEPEQRKETMPEGLDRERKGPLNKTTGRRPAKE